MEGRDVSAACDAVDGARGEWGRVALRQKQGEMGHLVALMTRFEGGMRRKWVEIGYLTAFVVKLKGISRQKVGEISCLVALVARLSSALPVGGHFVSMSSCCILW